MSSLGLSKISEDASFAPYRSAGDDFAKEQLAELAKQCGGEVGPGPASFISSAAVQLAASRWMSDRAAVMMDSEMFVVASRLSNDSRQNILAAHELGVREYKARKEAAGPVNPLAMWVSPPDDKGAK